MATSQNFNKQFLSGKDLDLFSRRDCKTPSRDGDARYLDEKSNFRILGLIEGVQDRTPIYFFSRYCCT